ncbi:dTDP-4-dehydrorhamnose reductase [Pseudonocardia hierapolitana]|uniref:dTDP-4-dehydrorhamnose reductase n=1 Tax=Pseudonocardia hierapolitana TaxID=1128676 RepID=A0A561SRB0_9PSEU|nr:dTDP-4-dehydrorhamnose reductase [Pseudonocardia hierapolitana]TWF77393.1 dTDP-4-dehydrorhamnose reductase [Pseudonocardia hierapolitana]
MRVLVLGAGGQVGRALVAALPDATALRRSDLDIADAASASIDWAAYDTIVNAAAFTDVDGAETVEGRAAAWRTNAAGPSALAAICHRTGSTLVHLSTEYVFDGRSAQPYPENAPVAPLSVYGASKAAGDIAVHTHPRHYVVRPSWVVGDGHNFVRTMLRLAEKGVEPSVVADQIGRLTFATDLAAAIVHLVASGAPYGSYHVTGGGEPASWADVARATFALAGHGDLRVTDTTTAEYFADKPHAARRPLNSVLDLSRAAAAGVELPDWRERLADYVRRS